MNKNFFEIKNKIKVTELLDILDINEEEFLTSNNNNIDKINDLFI